MNWDTYIKERAITIEEAASMIKSGDRISSGSGGDTQNLFMMR